LALSRLRVRTPKRNIVPLSVDEVARFWSSFRTSRDLAIVGLMLLQGLRSKEVLDLHQEDLLLSEAQLRVTRQGQQDPMSAAGSRIDSTARPLLAAGTAQPLCGCFLCFPQRTRPGCAHDAGWVALSVPLSSSDYRRGARQPTPVPPYFRFRHGTGRRQFARAHAVDGARPYSDYLDLHPGHAARGLPAICARGGPADPTGPKVAIVKRSRRPLVHPLAPVFWRAVESIALSLAPDTVRAYRAATRHFLNYLGVHHPEVSPLDQLRRDPHILDWLSSLRAETPPLVLAAYVNKLIRLRRIFEELAWLLQIPDLAHLLRREDSPRAEKCLPARSPRYRIS
jgi:hypothetical protein